MISSTNSTAISSVVCCLYCIVINWFHLHLTKISEARSTSFGKKLVVWSHLSMVTMSLSPIFIMCSCFHPELWFVTNYNVNNSSACFCKLWYQISLVFFITGLFLLKINYLVRLNMILNPSKGDMCTNTITIYIAALIIECVIVDVLQFVTVDAECEINITRKIFQHGCNSHFDKWSYVIF